MVDITRERLCELLAYDPVMGHFVWQRQTSNLIKLGARAGTLDRRNGYRQIRLDGVVYYEHRLAFFIVHGRWPTMVDHINSRRDDNRIENLREATHSQNMLNRASRNRLGRGVQQNRSSGRFEALIKIDGRLVYLGGASTLAEARAIRDAKAREVFGDFARFD